MGLDAKGARLSSRLPPPVRLHSGPPIQNARESVTLNPQTLLASSVHPSIQILGASERGERGIRNEMAAVARVFRGSRFLMSPAPGAAAAAGAKKAAAPQVTKADATAAKEKRGILKPVPVSEEMRRFAGGKPEVARSEAVKLIWAHIKANGLQV